MKKIIKGLAIMGVMTLCVIGINTACNANLYAGDLFNNQMEQIYNEGEAYRRHIAKKQVNTQIKAEKAYPIPEVNNFMERKTIHEWTKRWDSANKACYVYVFIGEKCIGYFVSNGKPASTQSYLIPESYDLYDVSRSSTHMVKQAMDIDGTYGANNPGYRMFLASGQAIEVSGYQTSVVYSDAPIPSLSSTCLGK